MANMTQQDRLRAVVDGSVQTVPDDETALLLSGYEDLPHLMRIAGKLRDLGHGDRITYSRKVFIPLTHLCRDVCHYCTFAQVPRRVQRAYLSAEEVLRIARAGKAAGCKEALFTLGDKPEARYRIAREELDALGYPNTLAYLAAMARLVFEETGLLPHLNPGLMSVDDIAGLREVAPSMGIMLESSSARLSASGGPHYGSPDKDPASRLRSIDAAGQARVPFTTGILIGIGETRRERVESLLDLRRSHLRFGHIQEIIIQNFCAKPETVMANAPEPDLEEHLWTIAMARILFGADMSIQAPPNLRRGALQSLVQAGINDWGGVSPVTIDHVNPEAPWPQLDDLARTTALTGRILVERLTVYPHYVADSQRWLNSSVARRVLELADASGLARVGSWVPGTACELDSSPRQWPTRHVATASRRALHAVISRAIAGEALVQSEIVALFEARGEDFDDVCAAADSVRQNVVGSALSFVVTRNINYTNVCGYRCQFCAFSKGKTSENLRGKPYELDRAEIARRVREAWARGATEVCLQGGIHPAYTGNTYLAILRAVKETVPQMHVHAFSPLEISHGAATLGLPLNDYLARLRDNGLDTLPGTAAEILDDDVRRIICSDKLSTEEWKRVVKSAHQAGIRSTATIMFGHVDRPVHWARHLLHLREIQQETGGFTEFVPLPFVPMETPIFLKGRSRRGATQREAILMHAVARLVFGRLIPNIQASWVKMGVAGLESCLRAGANDLGGTLMNETISRAAGAGHGEEMTPQGMAVVAERLARPLWQRTTLYAAASAERQAAAREAPPVQVIRLAEPLAKSSRIESCDAR